MPAGDQLRWSIIPRFLPKIKFISLSVLSPSSEITYTFLISVLHLVYISMFIYRFISRYETDRKVRIIRYYLREEEWRYGPQKEENAWSTMVADGQGEVVYVDRSFEIVAVVREYNAGESPANRFDLICAWYRRISTGSQIMIVKQVARAATTDYLVQWCVPQVLNFALLKAQLRKSAADV